MFGVQDVVILHLLETHVFQSFDEILYSQSQGSRKIGYADEFGQRDGRRLVLLHLGCLLRLRSQPLAFLFVANTRAFIFVFVTLYAPISAFVSSLSSLRLLVPIPHFSRVIKREPAPSPVAFHIVATPVVLFELGLRRLFNVQVAL
jgi:hypothetical protein